MLIQATKADLPMPSARPNEPELLGDILWGQPVFRPPQIKSTRLTFDPYTFLRSPMFRHHALMVKPVKN